jgi:predicted aconitase
VTINPGDDLRMSPADERMLRGDAGDGPRLAMRVIVAAARAVGAERLLDVTRAHIDGCLYHGHAGLDFAERLARAGARVTVPATLNVGSLDLLHPDRYRGDAETAALARRQMDRYLEMGCQPTWTCAPYQLQARPAFGEHVAWAESNAIVFANSVLGARTERYGDFVDICAAITGRVPDAGLHRTENRRALAVFSLSGLPERLLREDAFFPILGILLGQESGTHVPVIDGLPAATEDQLKALGAGAASSGAVAMFHAAGLTPEAPTLEAALQDRAPERVVEVTGDSIRRARDSLTTDPQGPLAAVSIGTPHFSLAEFERLVALVDGASVHREVDLFVSTGRDVLAEVDNRGWLPSLESAGVQVVTDTCTYVTPILRPRPGVVMTNSAKWAYYAPGNIGVEVAFGSLEECVRSAIEGRIRRDEALWSSV